MWGDDHASKWLGFELFDVREGFAVLKMTVQRHHTNGHGMCHGGVIFALADSTFAFACNSRNQRTVAQHGSISFLVPAEIGDQLRAEAIERSLRGRGGIYDVTVTNQDNVTIAEFRGLSRAIKGQIYDDAEE